MLTLNHGGKMKKLLLTTVAISLFTAGSALATPFQITDTAADLSAFGVGLWSFGSNSSGVYDLGVGDYFDFTFGTVSYPLAAATGTIDFTVSFAAPTLDGVSDEGAFSVFSLFFGSKRELTFGDPVVVDYSYGGFTGGQLQLDFNDISKGWVWGSSSDITGRVTNISDATTAPVPEPSTMLLFGAGLAGLVGYSRKRSNK
jgi:PEP-CTERM motif